MNHIDEGTIHAWIDGAVDAAQSREIEAHVAQCATCASAVAEARGFVAGASRILLALDDVPAGVTPKRAPRAPVAKREWRAAPWVLGIAATVLLTVGVMQRNQWLDRRTGAEQSLDAVKQPQVAVLSSEPKLGSLPVAAPPSVTPVTTGRRQVASTEVAKQAKAQSQRRPAVVDSGRQLEAQVVAANVGGAAGAASADARDRKAEAPAPAAAPQLAREAPMKSMALRGAADVAERAGAAEFEGLAGCYRYRPEQLLGKASDALPDAMANRAAGVRASAPAASAARAPSVAYVTSKAPGMLRLDSVFRLPGYLVRDVGLDSAIGRWRRIDGDSARVDLFARGVFTLARKDRVACPER